MAAPIDDASKGLEDPGGANLPGSSSLPETVERGPDEERPRASPAVDRMGPRVVSSGAREQAAAQLAASLTGAVAQFLLDAERQVVNRADRVRTSTLDDLERQRANVESLIGMFAERLGQQEEGLSSLQEEFEPALDRLDRHAEALRSLSQAQARHSALR